MKKLLYSIFFLFSAFVAESQQRIVLNNGAEIVLSGTITNPACLVVDNSNANAITRDSGYIYSEGEYNMVQWNISNSTGNYVVPFGYSSSLYLPLTLQLNTSPGSPGWTCAT